MRTAFGRIDKEMLMSDTSYDQSGQYSSDYGQQEQAQWSFDWSYYPSIARVLQAQGDPNTWLASLGVDASQLNQAQA
jgi:hypothetical protein